LLAGILASRSHAELAEATRSDVFDYSAPTDERPYFFNLIKPAALLRGRVSGSLGVVQGNLFATTTLLLLLGVSAVLVFLIILLPLWLARRPAGAAGRFGPGLGYFSLIGMGFMMVQIPYMQRFSVYLGHPTYAVVVILFSMILFTGIGSMLSERIPMRHAGRFAVGLSVAIAAVLGVALLTIQPVIEATISCSLWVRCLIVLAFTAPVSLLLGQCFPMGMRLLGQASDASSPWMWGVNGACSVTASALAVGVSMWVGIDGSLVLAALLYLALCWPALALIKRGAAVASAAEPAPQKPAEAAGSLVGV
jgi:hypothetical protein